MYCRSWSVIRSNTCCVCTKSGPFIEFVFASGDGFGKMVVVSLVYPVEASIKRCIFDVWVGVGGNRARPPGIFLYVSGDYNGEKEKERKKKIKKKVKWLVNTFWFMEWGPAFHIKLVLFKFSTRAKVGTPGMKQWKRKKKKKTSFMNKFSVYYSNIFNCWCDLVWWRTIHVQCKIPFQIDFLCWIISFMLFTVLSSNIHRITSYWMSPDSYESRMIIMHALLVMFNWTPNRIQLICVT